MAVVEEENGEFVGALGDPLIHPDTGFIEGFSVWVSGILRSEEVFCSGQDILRWGMVVTVRHRGVLGPVADCVRLQPLLEDPRTVLRQRIRTENGKERGKCADIQFDTEALRVTWLFPRKFLKWGIAIPLSEVLEVREDAIIVRDPPAMQEEPVHPVRAVKALEAIQDIADSGVARPS